MTSQRKIALVVSLLAATALLYFFGNIRSSRLRNFDTEAYLKNALISPLPLEITDLQGIGETWQGKNCFFRFHGNSEILETHLIERGFVKNPKFFPSEEPDRSIFTNGHTPSPNLQKYFTPPWNPDYQKNWRYFSRNNPNGSQTGVLLSSGEKWIHVWLRGS